MPLLNTADAVYVGDTPADRVYLGGTLVWPTAPPAEFSPDDLTGLIHWLRADDLTLASGAPVTSWGDRVSGTAAQTVVANQPTYQPAALGGQPAVRFDGANDTLTYGSVSWPATFTIVAVCRLATFVANAGPVGGDTNVLPNRIFQFRHNAANNIQLLSFHSGQAASNNSDTTAVTGQTSNAVMTSHRSTTEVRVFWNGAGDVGQPTSATIGNTSATLPLVIGSSAREAVQLFNGDIAEVIIYNRALSDSERAKVHSYVQDRYGITVADYIP